MTFETPFGMPWPEQDRLADAHLREHPTHRIWDQREDGGSLWCWTCTHAPADAAAEGSQS